MYTTPQEMLEDFGRWGVDHMQTVRYFAERMSTMRNDPTLDPSLVSSLTMFIGNMTFTLKRGRLMLQRGIDLGNELGYSMRNYNHYRNSKNFLMMALTADLCVNCRANTKRGRDLRAPNDGALIAKHMREYNRLMKFMHRKTEHDCRMIRDNNWWDPLEEFWMVLRDGQGAARLSFRCVAESLDANREARGLTGTKRQEFKDAFDLDETQAVYYGHERRNLCATCTGNRMRA